LPKNKFMLRQINFIAGLTLFLSACSLHKDTLSFKTQMPLSDTAQYKIETAEEIEIENGFDELISLESSIKIDIKYATTDNFVKEKMYNCGKCFLRPEVAAAIVKAQKQLQKKGYGLKMFDCYRPRPFQQKLWNKVPDDRYVTNPKKGSMHNRGAAVDLTLVDKNGKELDMGTPFDFFGEKAYQTCTDLPKNIIENRKLLNQTLESVGFKTIRTEWWHFSYTKKKYALSEWIWNCK
jgi:zinc D-Ala-D-Ala dipeptidase